METIAQRIMKVVEANGGNMSEFARAIGVTPAYISKLGKEPDRVPSDRTLSDICREFHVSETWLRTGEGEMHLNLDRKEELKAIFGDIMASDDAKARLVKAFAMLPDEAYPKLEEYIKKIAQELSKE